MAVQRIWFMGAGAVDLVFDCVVRESLTSRTVITKNPVDTGASLSDHAYDEPDVLVVEAEVSDTWLHARDPQGSPRPDIYSSALGPDDIALFGVDGERRRSATAWKILKGLKASHEPFDVQSGLELHTDYMITDLECDQDKMTAGKLAFRATLEQVIRGGTKTITYPPRQAGKPHRQASKTVAAGSQSTTPITDPVKASTVARQFYNLATGSGPTDFVAKILP